MDPYKNGGCVLLIHHPPYPLLYSDNKTWQRTSEGEVLNAMLVCHKKAWTLWSTLLRKYTNTLYQFIVTINK